MEPGNFEETSTENAKISDSGYSNTCSNSQSHTSSGSSVSRNSSGYHGGNPSNFESSTETLPKPIAKRKDKGCKKKKKSKNASAANQHPETAQVAATACPVPGPACPADTASAAPASVAAVQVVVNVEPYKPTAVEKCSEVAIVELVDATDPGVHNDNNLTSGGDTELASKTNPIDEPASQSTEEYYAVISMHDGLVLYATPSLHSSLGYPKDSWTGKLFIDLFESKDKDVLTEKISNEIAASRDYRATGTAGRKESIYCRLRRCNAISCISAAEQQQQHFAGAPSLPYRINLLVQNFHEDKSTATSSQLMLLVASFQPVHSAYKVPEETIISTVFTTRHTAACRLSYVDPEVVQYLGYLPQDMIDRSLFDFYYPEDLPLIKDIYETIISSDNSSFRSKPYRYIVQNGDLVVMETEWSSFINPWSKSLEFVVGQHRILKGPANPDVFRSPAERPSHLFANLSEEILKEAKVIQQEIRALLAQGVQRKPSYAVMDCDLIAKKKELASFAENILQEIKSPAPNKDHMAVDDRSFSEHDSVMLGEISPHHEYFDSKSSSETPPSYNQLNYHDNIERFFNSDIGMSVTKKPYGSDEENVHSSANSSDELGKNNNCSRPERKCTSSTNGSGNSGSAENLSSESNNQQSFGSRGETSNATSNSTNDAAAAGQVAAVAGRFKAPILTESLLNRHNEDMEKLMVQKHRKQKKDDKRNKCALGEQSAAKQGKPEQTPANRITDQQPANLAAKPNGLKRTASQNWEAQNNFKISKYDESAKVTQNLAAHLVPSASGNYSLANMDSSTDVAKTNANVWPSIPVSVPSTTTITHQCFTTPNACSQAMGRFSTFPQMFPVYYMPVPQSRDNPPLSTLPQEHPGPPPNLLGQPAPYCFVPVPYMATAMSSVMYPPIIGPPPMYRQFIVPETVPATASAPLNLMPQPTSCPSAQVLSATNATVQSSFDLKRPASRETSVKAEPGSTMAMSEFSKKIFSPGGIVSSCVSYEGGCFSVPDEHTTANTKETNYTTEDKATGSQNSSFFSSSLNGSSNTDQCNTVSSFESKESRVNQQRRKAKGMVRKEPPWIEGVKITPELVYQYQIGPKSLSEVLKADLDFLRQSKQPSMVNDQLGQLFLDLDLEGFGSKLLLEETSTNSASDSSSDSSQSPSRMGAW